MRKSRFFALVFFLIFVSVSSFNSAYGSSISKNSSIAGKAKVSYVKKPLKANSEPFRFFDRISQIVKSNADNEPKVNGMALAGFILSLVGIGGLGIIFSAIGLAQINKNPEKYTGKGFAIAGLILGILDVIFWTIIYLAILNSM